MLFDEKHEPKPSAFVSDEQFELSECNPNGLKCSVLWWLITSYHAVFKLRSGLLSKCRVKTFSSHLGLRTTCHLFCWYCFGLFCIIWGKNGLHNGTELQRSFFFFLFYVTLWLDSSKEKNKQLLLRAKLTFKIKTATSRERTVKSCSGSRDTYYFRAPKQYICWLWLKWGGLVCVVNSDLNSIKTQQHQPLQRLLYADYL